MTVSPPGTDILDYGEVLCLRSLARRPTASQWHDEGDGALVVVPSSGILYLLDVC